MINGTEVHIAKSPDGEYYISIQDFIKAIGVAYQPQSNETLLSTIEQIQNLADKKNVKNIIIKNSSDSDDEDLTINEFLVGTGAFLDSVERSFPHKEDHMTGTLKIDDNGKINEIQCIYLNNWGLHIKLNSLVFSLDYLKESYFEEVIATVKQDLINEEKYESIKLVDQSKKQITILVDTIKNFINPENIELLMQNSSNNNIISKQVPVKQNYQWN